MSNAIVTPNKRFTPEYRAWLSIKTRCYNPRFKQYKDYGGRGIYVCDKWRASFAVFLADMGFRPNGFSIDRINNDGPYSANNCRWASVKVQARNKRIYSNNKVGAKGVCLRNNGKYQASIRVNGKAITLGTYATIERAAEARKAGEIIYWHNFKTSPKRH